MLKLAAEAKIVASQPEPTPIAPAEAPAEVEAKPELPVPGDTAALPSESEEALEAERAENALAEEAERVLMGREISISGMRVDPSPLLGLGDDVRLAIHAGSQEQPLVVTAKVHRDDGDRGVVLRFHQLDRVASKLLDEVLDELPVIEPSRRDSGAGMIVSEILASTV